MKLDQSKNSDFTFEMTSENVEKIIKKIKSHINDDNNGYCRVGWAMAEILGTEQVLKKVRITSLITQSGKYKAESSVKDYRDWDIMLNSDYQKSQLEIKLAKSTLKAYKLNNKATIINVSFGLINLILLVIQILLLI